MKIDKRIIGVCSIASKDKTRPILACVRFEKGKAVATDGFRLLEIDQNEVADDQIPAAAGLKYKAIDDVNIPVEPLTKFVKNIKGNKKLPVLNLAWSTKSKGKGNVSLIATDLETTSIMEVAQPEGEYPEYKKIIGEAKQREATAEITFNAELLAGLLHAITRAGAQQNLVTFKITGAKDAMLVTAKDWDDKPITGLMMPVRLP